MVIALFVISAVIMSSSVCHVAGSISGGSLDPNRPACMGGRPCPRPTGRYPGRPSRGAPSPYNGGIGQP
ncbi:hypothetical protein ZWY2020_002661 [Hordeum vulgare]|nr:hypothetical protein ZWY2020_002661 [Hordeum vulgare]